MKKILILVNVVLLVSLLALYAVYRASKSPTDSGADSETNSEKSVLTGEEESADASSDDESATYKAPATATTPPQSSPTTPKTTDQYGASEPSSGPSVLNLNSTATKDQFGRRIVKYYYTGFSPELVEIKQGDAVRFINASYGTMWIKTTGNPGSPDFLAELDTGQSLSPGKEFVFTFLKSGTWGYINMNHKQHMGAVVVQPK